MPDRQYIPQGTHLRNVLLRSLFPQSKSFHEPLQAPDDVEYVPRETLEHRSREQHDHSGVFQDDTRIHSWAQRYARHDPIQIDGDPPLLGLNPTQIRAIAMMLGERISFVQGVSLSWATCHLICPPSVLASWNRKDKNYHRSNQASQASQGFSILLCFFQELVTRPFPVPFRSPPSRPRLHVYQCCCR